MSIGDVYIPVMLASIIASLDGIYSGQLKAIEDSSFIPNESG